MGCCTMGQNRPKCKETPLPLTVNVIDFEFFVLNVPEWVPWSPLDPKCYNTLVELFRFTEYVEKNKMHIAPFLKFQ